MKLLSATGMLGSGFREASIVEGVDRGAAMIGCDSGTTDFGPHPLATGRSQFSRAAMRRESRDHPRAGQEGLNSRDHRLGGGFGW